MNPKKQKDKNMRPDEAVSPTPNNKPWSHSGSDLINIEGTTEPTIDPCEVYPPVEGIDCNDFRLPPDGLSAKQRDRALKQLQAYEKKQKEHFLGYQANQLLDYENDLKQYLNYHINNIGDPFQDGNFTLNSKWMERAVLDYYASLWNARWPHDPKDGESYWGYIVSMGSTEGNLYGLWNGRDYLAGKFLMEDPTAEAEARAASKRGKPRPVQRRLIYQQALPPDHPGKPGYPANYYTPVAFYSEDTHYSIVKAMRVLSIHNFYEIGTAQYPGDYPLAPGKPWPKEVPSVGKEAGPGSIDIEALAQLVEFFAAKGHPILVCFNYGTTFKGAYDDVEAAGDALLPILKKYGLDKRKVYYDPKDRTKYDVRNGFWFHVDGALGAAYMPFVELGYNLGGWGISQRGPNFDFRLPFVHSIAMSGHKWIGAPWPCGIYMTKVKFQLSPPDDPSYLLGAQDTSFAGSRNGFSAMIFWDYLAKNSYGDQIEKAAYTEKVAKYAYDKLSDLETELGQDLWVERTPLSLTIRFKRVNDQLVFKYSLSGEELWVEDQKREYSHIFIMAHVTEKLIDALIEDLKKPGAFKSQEVDGSDSRPDLQVAGDAKKLIYVPHTGRGFK